MKQDSYPVKLRACVYCRMPIGAQHAFGCVMRKRTVDIELTVTIPVLFSEDSDAESIELFFNESSSCADNLIEDMKRAAKLMGCLCHRMDVRFVGESTYSVEELEEASK